MVKTKKVISTYEREMKNPRFKTAFDKKYKEFLLSETLIKVGVRSGIKQCRKS